MLVLSLSMGREMNGRDNSVVILSEKVSAAAMVVTSHPAPESVMSKRLRENTFHAVLQESMMTLFVRDSLPVNF
jgi:hypothetical protein